MRKLICFALLMSFCVGGAFAWNPFGSDSEQQPKSIAHGTFSTSQSTPVSSACDVETIIVDSTGIASPIVLTLRDSTTDKISITVSATGETKVIELSDVPFSTNLNLSADVADTTVRYTIIYRLR